MGEQRGRDWRLRCMTCEWRGRSEEFAWVKGLPYCHHCAPVAESVTRAEGVKRAGRAVLLMLALLLGAWIVQSVLEWKR